MCSLVALPSPLTLGAGNALGFEMAQLRYREERVPEAKEETEVLFQNLGAVS